MHFSFENPDAATDVFILGAGFSKAISDRMPLLTELSAITLSRLGPRLKADEVPFLGSGGTANFELAMTYLAQRHPWLSEADHLRNQAKLLDIAEVVAPVIEECTEAALEHVCPTWLQRLVHWMHYRQAIVITLNYDTLLERAFSMIEMRQIMPGMPPGLLRPESLYPITLRLQNGQVITGRTEPTIQLLKLHGSTNWFYYGARPAFGEEIELRLIAGWKNSASEKDARTRTTRTPLIVPPVADKLSYFENQEMRTQWAIAAESVRRARRVFLIGYSFPATDLTMRFLLQSNQPAGDVEVAIINNDPEASKHYRSVLSRWPAQPKEYASVMEFSGALFEPEYRPVNVGQSSGSRRVRDAVRNAISDGAILQTVAEGKFSVKHLDDDLCILLLGEAEVPIVLPWDAQLETRMHQQPPMLVSGGEFIRRNEPARTVDEFLYRWVNRATGRWIAGLLKTIGAVEVTNLGNEIQLRPLL